MHASTPLPYLGETLVFLVLSGILIPLLQRLRINQVIGFLAAGMLVGPFGIGLWVERFPALNLFSIRGGEGVSALAELGVLFLMFMIGLELSAQRLWALRRWVFAGGMAQITVSALIIGTIALAFGNETETAVVLGLVLALSSTAAVIQLLNERHALGTPLGQSCFSILMMQDLAVVPLFILLGVLSGGTEDRLAWLLGTTLLKSVLAVGMIYIAGRRLIRPLYRHFSLRRRPDTFMAITLLVVLGTASLTASAGLSMALGAFLAGLLIAETEFRIEVEAAVEPFRGLLMGLFFLSVGMQLDLRQVIAEPLWLPLSVIGLFAIKSVVIAGILRLGGFGWRSATEGGLLLGQGGEFAFIIIGTALAGGIIHPPLAQFMMLVVGLSLAATPAAAFAGRWLGRQGQHRPVLQEPAAPTHQGELRGHVVIAGMGRVGQVVAQILEAENIPHAALDCDTALVAALRRRGVPVHSGDATRTDLLHRLHAGQAAAIVLTMDDPPRLDQAIASIRREFPGIPLLARARDESQALSLRQAGADKAFPETLEAALQMSNSLLHLVGVKEKHASDIIEVERDRRTLGFYSAGQSDAAPGMEEQMPHHRTTS